MSTSEEKLVLKLITDLKKQPGIADFLYPVDYEKLGLTDYPLAITRPMDLATVQTKLRKHVYESLNQCVQDLQLIWENCRTYNVQDSQIVRNAEKFEKRVEAFINKHGTENEVCESPIVSFEDKMALSEQVKRANAKTLGEVVKIVMERCPSAVTSPVPDRVRIRVDAIDGETYYRLKALVKGRK